jgi:hypothetical protein
MKKQLLNIGKALSRAEQKQVFGGKMAAEDGDGFGRPLCESWFHYDIMFKLAWVK